MCASLSDSQWTLAQAELALGASARRDAQILLCTLLNCNTAYLRAWPDKRLSPAESLKFAEWLALREQGTPVAHIVGQQAFWGLELKVSPLTLIPRQDTETLVETCLGLAVPERARVLDLGTGTGAIALALASEKPDWTLTGLDYCQSIVDLAIQNAQDNSISTVRFLCSDWYAALGGERFELIVSNPPYIEEGDPHLVEGDLRFEARSALVAADEGLADLRHIVAEARRHLSPGGFLAVEHGYEQAMAVRGLFVSRGYSAVDTVKDYSGNDRVTLGKYSGHAQDCANGNESNE